jgi:HAD superfamily hydrolase (TIGR01509 family)
MLELPNGSFDAYLFDCDGTIVDSMPIHYLAWRRVLEPYGFDLSEDQFYAYGGRVAADAIAEATAGQPMTVSIPDLLAQHEQYFLELLPQVKPIHAVLGHIREAYGKMPLAVVSGSTREIVTRSLEAVGLLDRFDVLVCAGDYVKPKPDPECFLAAAAKMGVEPARCVVFEDAELGIQAAQAAGMAAVKVG